MGAYSGVKAFFKKPITEMAESLGYADDNLLILRGDAEELQRRFPQTYQNILSCRHHADHRTPLEYAQDLVASWLFEDFFRAYFTSDAYSITLNGADRSRQILADTKTSSSSDYEITYGGRKIKMELMNDYTGFWERTETLHLRDEKYRQLAESRALLLTIAAVSKKFKIFDFRADVPCRHIASHKPYGGKPANELSISAKELIPLSKENMEAEILRHLKDVI